MKRSDEAGNWAAQRDRIIGLGEGSLRKSYYPALRRNLAELQMLLGAIEQTAEGVVICNRAGTIEFVNPAMCAMTGYSADQLIGATPRLYRSEATPRDTHMAMWAVLTAGEPWRGELCNRRRTGEPYWVRLSITPIRDEGGTITHFVGINEDVTERRRAEERQKRLIDELNHRVKNTLAEIQSLASLSLSTAESPEAFRREFQGRLLALSRTHNLLNLSAWGATSLRAVLESAVDPAASGVADRIDMRGDDLPLTPNAAVFLGMVFHELAGNAVRFGALSAPGGRVAVTWAAAFVSGRRVLSLEWAEHGGPVLPPPARRGFGRQLLERGVAHQLGGTTMLDFRPEGLSCRFELPLDRLQADEA